MLNIVRDLDRVTTRAELGARLLELTRPLGVECVVAGVLPNMKGVAQPAGGCESRGLAASLHKGGDLLPDAVLPLEQQTTLRWFRDPVNDAVTHVEENESPLADPDAPGRASCLDFPILAVGEKRYGVSFCGRDLALGPTDLHTLSFFANYAFARMLKLDAPTRPKLTDRQCEILGWAAEGKTDKEIAVILKVSEHTIDKYMRQCRESLDAVNRTAAIVRAMRLGLIA